MERIVLLVDDERLPIQFYVKALTSEGFVVRQFTEPDSALEFAKSRQNHVCVIILDVMMPPGLAYENVDTDEGLRTGIFLVEDLAHYYPGIPVIILTNVTNPNTLNALDEIKRRGLVRTVIQKTKCSPFELADLIKKTIQANNDRPA